MNYVFIWLFCLGLAHPIFSRSVMAAPVEKESFSEIYRKQTNNTARRDLVLKAIDGGLIHRGMRYADIEHLFGGENIQIIPETAAVHMRAVIYFTPAPHLRDPLMASAPSGWYIDLVFDEGKYLIRYSLSNLHK